MKNILIVFAMFLIGFTSCSKDGPEKPDPEPVVDYEVMLPKLEARLYSYQTALNNKDYKTVFEIIENKGRFEFGVYPTPSVASLTSSKVTIIRTLSGITTTSKVVNGTVIYKGSQKIVIKKEGVSDKELILNFTATFTCRGDKMTTEDWKLTFSPVKL